MTFKSIIYSVGLLAVGILAAGYFFAAPQWSRYSLLKDQLATVKIDNQNLMNAQAALQNFLDSFNKYQAQGPGVNLALPRGGEDLANLTYNLGSLASLSSITLSNFSIDESTLPKQPAKNSIQAAIVGLSASGTYPALRDFVLRLESNQRILDIMRITLKSGDNNLIQSQISLRIYYQR